MVQWVQEEDILMNKENSMIKSLVQWHKDRIECFANHFGLSQYQLLLITAFKGTLIGYLVGAYL